MNNQNSNGQSKAKNTNQKADEKKKKANNQKMTEDRKKVVTMDEQLEPLSGGVGEETIEWNPMETLGKID